MKTKKRLLSILLSLVLVLGLVPGMSLTAYAASASYVDGNGDNQNVNATELASNTTSWTNGSWYIVPEGGLTISSRIAVNGTVNLILRDGATLTASAGITTTNATLNIYAQSGGTGALTATGGNGARAQYGGSAGIGGVGNAGRNGDGYYIAGVGGTVNIYGGAVTATGGNGATNTGGGAGIGGGGLGHRSPGGGDGGTVNIYGGTVTATGGNGGEDGGGGAGIGGGGNGWGNSAGAAGTLTLGKCVKLYQGTDNTGTVLDDSASVERSYSGSRPKNMFAEYSHTHSFTYTAGGNTITATCAGTDSNGVACTLEDLTATLTIVGSDTGAKFEGDVKAFSPLPDVNYYKANDDGTRGAALAPITTAPTVLGKYWAEITLGDGDNSATAHVVYEIKAKASIGTNSYDTLQQAIDAATDNQTIKLTENVTGTFTFNKSNTIVTLDLNGHTIDGDQQTTAITISNGTLILNDTSGVKTGEITGAKQGVAVNGGTFKLEEGKIQGNIGNVNGAGVSVAKNATFEMIGGAIQYNQTTTYTGGVLLNGGATFIMSGGAIQYNSGAADGFGGIGSAGAEPKVSGTAVIRNNVIGGTVTKNEDGYSLTGGTPCNYRSTDKTKKIVIAGALTTGAKIGVYNIYDANVAFTSGYNTFNTDDSGNKFFFSDDANKGIHKNGDGELIFGDPIPITLLDDNTKPVITVKRGETTVTLGAPQIGDVLTAETDATDLVYEWYRDNVKIDSATEDTYTLTAVDLGKAITVTVYQTKDANGNELTGDNRPTQTSTATAAVEKKTAAELSADDAKTNGITFTYTGETISANNGYEVSSTNTGDGTAITSLTDILDGEGTPTIYVRTAATDDTAAGAWVEVTLTARPAAPTGLTSEPPAGTADGKIKGTTADMEYKLKNSTGGWTTASASETSVASGTYLVRTKATDTTPAGRATEVAVVTAAENVNNLIDALPEAENVTTADKDDIEAARAAYNALTDTQKATVSTDTLAKLGAVEAALAIAELPEASAVTTANKIAIEAARTAYDALSAEQKTAVGDTAKAKLEAAEAALAIVELPAAAAVTANNKTAIEAARTKYNELSDTQKEAVGNTFKAKLEEAEVALVNTLIDALPAAAKVKTSDKEAIEAARAAYNALTDNQKLKVSADTLKKLTDAEAALAEAALKEATDTAAANTVSETINALPAAAKVKTSDKDAIAAARAAYDALTDDQKAKVSADTLAKLTAAEDALAVADVNEKINALPAASDVTTANKDAITAARAAYNALTDNQKLKVSADTLKKLTDAEAALAEAALKEATDTAAANTVSETINALPAAADVKTSNKEAIEAARAAYNALTDDQKSKVSDETLKKLTDAEDALAAATVSETINALPAAADVKTSNKEAIAAARAAYDALTDAQKEKVSADTLAKLTVAEDALAVADVNEKINALPAASDVSTANKDAITAARAAYNALTDNQKSKVSADTLKKLTDAEAALAEAALKEATDTAAANTVSETINALPAAADVKTSNKEAIEAARAAYNALTDDQKSKVSAETLKKLTDAEDALAAATVSETINALPAAADVKTSDKAAIEAARTAYNALTNDQKAKVSADTLKKLTDAETALAELQKDAGDIQQNDGDVQQNPDGTKSVTKEDNKENTITVTHYDKQDKPIEQFVYQKAKGTSIDLKIVNSNNIKKIVVPATVKSGGKTYKVTRVRKGFMKNCKKAKEVVFGKNVNRIDNKAMQGGSNVKNVTIKGKLKKLGKNALKGMNKNGTIKIKTNQKTFEKNNKLLQKTNLPKNVKIKWVKNKK